MMTVLTASTAITVTNMDEGWCYLQCDTFVRMSSRVQGLHYNDRLEQLGLIRLRLEERRMRSDLIETFKIMNGHYNIYRDLFLA